MIEIDGYQVIIEWSDEDKAYLVSIPQLEQETGCLMPCSHGDTYEEAIKEAKISIRLVLAPDMFAPPRYPRLPQQECCTDNFRLH